MKAPRADLVKYAAIVALWVTVAVVLVRVGLAVRMGFDHLGSALG